MLLKFKDKDSLLKDLKAHVFEERKILNLILHHLKEIEARKLHLEMGYPNLYAFCTKELGYSEAGSHRRISAMRLMREIPEVEEKIRDGVLNLSVISQAQSFFRVKKEESAALNSDEKREVLNKLANKTARESEKFLLSLAPHQIPQERRRAITNDVTEFKFTLNQRAVDKLETIRARFSHKNPTTSEIFEMGLDLLLKENNAALPPTRREKINKATSSRYIPKATKKIVTNRDHGQCQYVDPKTGKVCGSSFYLQYDHIKPMALGGKTELNNLRLLCSNHNKFMWEKRRQLEFQGP